MMDYELIEPPFGLRLKDRMDLDFEKLTKREARAYAAWFHEQAPKRIALLVRAVRSTPAYEDWVSDFSLESLDALTRWLAQKAAVRRRSLEEIEDYLRIAPPWIEKVRGVGEFDLSEETYSLCYDIGMYFATVLEANLKGLRWTIVERPKRSIDIHQPVLTGFGKLEFNPVQMMTVQAWRAVRKEGKPPDLRQLFDIWSQDACT